MFSSGASAMFSWSWWKARRILPPGQSCSPDCLVAVQLNSWSLFLSLSVVCSWRCPDTG
jgi:hypothetical protein